MNFDFNEVNNSQSTTFAQLEGNKIHDVTFEGCEARDFAGVQDPTRNFRVLEIKFKNDEGVFTHTIWEPREEDAQDRQGAFGPQPSALKEMKYLIKHLIDAVNPELGKQIDSKQVSLSAPNWDAFRKLVVTSTDPGKGTETKIKLIKNNKGDARFPYFLNYNRSGALYMSTNFIGKGVFFTSKELDRIKKSESKPVPVAETMTTPAPKNDDFDMSF